MTQPANHWKLGLFVVISFLLALVGIIYIGAKALNRDAVIYRSYFDESVTGLEIGSVVKFRGVTIGTVSGVDVAPDHRHVEVSYGLRTEVLHQLNIAKGEDENTHLSVPADLRAQVAAQGVTGQKYILIDFFDPKTHPIRKLPFPVPERSIPAADSPLKNIEDSVVKAVNRFPELADQMSELLGNANRLLVSVEEKQLATRAGTTLENVDATVKEMQTLIVTMRGKVQEVPVAELSAEVKGAIAHFNETMSKLQLVIERVDGDQGLVASMQRATDSVGDVAGDAQHIGEDLTDTLYEVRKAASALRQVLDALERDSDMLVKGRAELSE
jgi:ABC-type transporter Mla subunit MlaD